MVLCLSSDGKGRFEILLCIEDEHIVVIARRPLDPSYSSRNNSQHSTPTFKIMSNSDTIPCTQFSSHLSQILNFGTWFRNLGQAGGRWRHDGARRAGFSVHNRGSDRKVLLRPVSSGGIATIGIWGKMVASAKDRTS